MKLSEQSGLTYPGAELLESHLKIAGLTELAGIASYGTDGSARFYLATDAGLYVASFVPKIRIERKPSEPATLNCLLTAWSDVSGASMITSGTVADDGVSLSVRIANPPVHIQVAKRNIDALREFAAVCLRLQRGWASATPIDE